MSGYLPMRILHRLLFVSLLVGIMSGCGQTYWYCWDTGDPDPHHLGYRVLDDHYCSQDELTEAGFE